MTARAPARSATGRTRVCWVSDLAFGTWRPRLRALGEALLQVRIASVLRGDRRCAVVCIPAHALAQVRAACPGSEVTTTMTALGDGADLPLDAPQLTLTLCVATPGDAKRYLAARESGDAEGLATLFGEPDCCSSAARRNGEAGHRDPGWRLLEAAPPCETTPVAFPALTNALLHPLGFGATAHAPCSVRCAPSLAAAERSVALGRELGFEREMTDLLDVLDWPMGWSTAHGTAEVKTPVLKFLTPSDPTARRRSALRAGTSVPEHAAYGSGYPYSLSVRNVR